MKSPGRQPRGTPFYLGGDEGLVLAPVTAALDVAHGIKEVWDETAGSTAEGATLSMGIALFDRERSLGAAIETARRALEDHASAWRGRERTRSPSPCRPPRAANGRRPRIGARAGTA